MKTISPKSRSFLRFKKYATPVGFYKNYNSLWFINEQDKNIRGSIKEIREFLIKNNKDEREVYYAENLNIKTEKELRTISQNLSKYILKRLEKDGYNLNNFAGVVELHPTNLKEDETSKNAHIHYWGQDASIVSNYINEFIYKNQLSNKELKDYKYGFMENNIYYQKEDTTDDLYKWNVNLYGFNFSIEEKDDGIKFYKEERNEYDVIEAKPVEIKIEEVKKDIEIEQLKNQDIDDVFKGILDYLDEVRKEYKNMVKFVKNIENELKQESIEKLNILNGKNERNISELLNDDEFFKKERKNIRNQSLEDFLKQ